MNKKQELSNEELVELYQQFKDPKILNLLYLKIQKLIYLESHRVIKKDYLKYLKRMGIYSLEDLISEFKIQFIRSVENFDVTKDYKFTTLMTKYIRMHTCKLMTSSFYKKRNIDENSILSISFRNSDKDHEKDKNSVMEERLINYDNDNNIESNYSTKLFLEQVFSSNLLSKNQEMILKLVLLGYTQADISKAMNITRNNVSSVLYTTRNKLREFSIRNKYDYVG